MTITNNYKLIAVLAILGLIIAFVPAASADTTTAGFYDQFGQYHIYQTYSAPNNPYGVVYQYGDQNQYGQNQYGYNQNGYNANRAYGAPGTCSVNEVYNATNNICVPLNTNTAVVDQNSSNFSGLGFTYNGINTNSTNSVAKSSAVSDSGSVVKNDNYQSSAIASLFGGKKKVEKLDITNIVVTSGPTNIYSDKSEVNCEISVTWTTGVATAGQVVYGKISQPDVNTFNYSEVAPEGNSYKKQHDLKLGCLENETYYFRVIAFSTNERVVSDEQTIFPIKIRTQIPTVGAVKRAISSDGGSGSALSTIGSILASPITLILILLIIGSYIVMRMIRKAGKAQGGGHGPAHTAEPVLQIPH